MNELQKKITGSYMKFAGHNKLFDIGLVMQQSGFDFFLSFDLKEIE